MSENDNAAGRRSRLSAAKRAWVAQRLQSASAADAQAMLESDMPGIIADPEHAYDPFPLTDIQQAYWMGRQSAFAGGGAAHGYLEVDARGLDIERFDRAFQAVVRRHDMLRAIISPDGYLQVLRDPPAYRIRTLDLRGRPSHEVARELMRVRERMSHQVLPAGSWPLFEIAATRVGDVIRLHFSMDVLIADAWSFQIISHELWQLYQDPQAELAELQIRFRDYVQALQSIHRTDCYHRCQAYWLGRIESLPSAPQLPLAHGSLPQGQIRFVRRGGRLSRDAWTRLKGKAARWGVTPSAVAITAFGEILALWSNSDRFTINLTLFHRPPVHPQLNAIVGDFTSLTMLAVEEAMSGPFEARVSRLQKQLWSDLDHRYFSGVEVLRELHRRLPRSPSTPPMPIVFTSMLGHAGGTEGSGALRRFGEIVYAISQTPQVWLDVQVSEADGELIHDWDAAENILPPGMLEEMVMAYQTMLESLADRETAGNGRCGDWRDPLHRPCQSPITSSATLSGTRLLHEWVVKQAERRPDAQAVITADRTLTYAEVERCSRMLARRLRSAGARPNQLVGVVLEKGWEQVVAALGVLRSGAAYLPIDPALPPKRIEHLLRDGQVKVVLTQPRICKTIRQLAEPDVLCIHVEDPGQDDDSALESIQQESDLAYVIYTSGSTGMPKGVMISHRAAANTIADVNERFSITQQDRVLGLSSLSFDLSAYDMVGILAAGGCIVIPKAAALRDPAHWLELMQVHRVTVWNTVPALMEMLLEFLDGAPISLPESLRLVLLSGDWIAVSLPDRIRAKARQAKIVSLGGATEAAIWSILYPIGEVSAEWRSIPYGRPMKNQDVRVLNRCWESCPTWVPGELYISGEGLAEGYWCDTDRTNRAFLRHPVTGERLYRTGDWGRWLPDGNIEFLGRQDTQVKIQGFRIELGEIESALAQCPGIRCAVVGVRGAPHDQKHLVAYYVANPGCAPTVEHMQTFLKQRLPVYMVPSVFVRRSDMPLSTNGKVDRAALASSPEASPEPAKASGPRDAAVADRIARLVAQVLHVNHVDNDSDLLLLGINSVAMVRICNALSRELGFRPDLEQLYAAPCVNTLVRAYEQRGLGQKGVGGTAGGVSGGHRPDVPEEMEEGLV